MKEKQSRGWKAPLKGEGSVDPFQLCAPRRFHEEHQSLLSQRFLSKAASGTSSQEPRLSGAEWKDMKGKQAGTNLSYFSLGLAWKWLHLTFQISPTVQFSHALKETDQKQRESDEFLQSCSLKSLTNRLSCPNPKWWGEKGHRILATRCELHVRNPSLRSWSSNQNWAGLKLFSTFPPRRFMKRKVERKCAFFHITFCPKKESFTITRLEKGETAAEKGKESVRWKKGETAARYRRQNGEKCSENPSWRERRNEKSPQNPTRCRIREKSKWKVGSNQRCNFKGKQICPSWKMVKENQANPRQSEGKLTRRKCQLNFASKSSHFQQPAGEVTSTSKLGWCQVVLSSNFAERCREWPCRESVGSLQVVSPTWVILGSSIPKRKTAKPACTFAPLFHIVKSPAKSALRVESQKFLHTCKRKVTFKPTSKAPTEKIKNALTVHDSKGNEVS